MRPKALAALALAALLSPLAALPAGSVTTCFGLAPTITALPGVPTMGGPGDDVILGTAGDDVIHGGPGKDRICGLGGADHLHGGGGRDRISGGEGDDAIDGDGGSNQVLNGDGGNDTIRAEGSYDQASGGPGDDVVRAYTAGIMLSGGAGADNIQSFAAFVALAGEGGNDRLRSSYRNDLDAGPGFDRCSLDLAVPGLGCERVTLLCGSGGTPLPLVVPPDLTTAPGDFDGNGIDDLLYVWKDGTQWVAHIETDGGFGAETVLPTHESIAARALGGRDVNGDGMDEAFMVVDAGASSEVVGIYTLWEALGSPTLGFSCGLVPVLFDPVPAEASFVIDYGILHQTGLQCRADDTLREYSQETTDGVSYLQHRYNYAYHPGFGVSDPALWAIGDTQVTLTAPGQQALIDLAGQFTCSPLSL